METPLQKLKEAIDASSPGPWRRDAVWAILRYADKYEGDWTGIEQGVPTAKDADFICMAKQYLPLLLEYIRLVQDVGNRRTSLDKYENHKRMCEIEKELGL